MITKYILRVALRALRYEPSGDGTLYQPSWEDTSEQITVDVSRKRIGYLDYRGFTGNKDTTCNASDNANAVVLANVNILLDTGYRPDSLALERAWAHGHAQKNGRADISINDATGDTLASDECTTPGTEFTNACKNIQSDGGQLRSYWQQERATRWMVLISCDCSNNELAQDQVSISCSDDDSVIALAKRVDTFALDSDVQTVEQRHQLWTESCNRQL